MPLEAHIKEHPAYFHRFEALWTPSVIILDSEGKERWRMEGYLPKEEFRAQLELGLARLAFMEKKFAEAERMYTEVTQRYPKSKAASEALYWQNVSHYKATNDHTVFADLPGKFKEKYPESVWALKAQGWS